MKQMKQSKNNRLYYYCKLSTAIEHILPKRQILINPVSKTNDPRENKCFIFAHACTYAGDYISLSDPDNEVTKELRRDCKMICFSCDHKIFFGYEYSRMWALYGDNHKGICIQLNKEKFISENQQKIHPHLFKKIKYYEFKLTHPISHILVDIDRIKEIGITEYVYNEFRENHLEYLFFTKNHEWESEHEYRLVYFSENTDNEYCKIDNCIENIYLGVDFNLNYLKAVIDKIPGINAQILKYSDVRLVPGKRYN